MDLAKFREYCLSKANAAESTPFGPDVLVFKVSGKIFALASLDQVPATANLKCDPDLALELRDRYEQVTPGYHMNKKHWNTVEIESGIPEIELRKMIDHSYELVVSSLPKSKRVRNKGGSASPKTMLSSSAAYIMLTAATIPGRRRHSFHDPPGNYCAIAACISCIALRMS